MKPDLQEIPSLTRLIPGKLLEPSVKILQSVRRAGGRGLLVGGCVRDALLGRPVTEVDIEIFGLISKDLESLLAEDFRVAQVGKFFGVFKLQGHDIDVSMPRRELKIGPGHKGFSVQIDTSMSIEEAAARRDFTVNAMSLDILTEELFDPFDGRKDLKNGILRHSSDKFSEDPLRVLRAMQFAARFEFTVDKSTVALCARITPENLPPERILEEWKKLILLGRTISIGLSFLKDCSWSSYYPELQALAGCPQDPDWHPEGDVWTHTLHCMDVFARERTGDNWEDLVVGLAVLCHDMGKPSTTRFHDGHTRSIGHSKAGVDPTRSFLSRMTNQKDLIESVTTLVLHHLRPAELYKSKASDAAIRRLAAKVGRLDRLMRVARADMQGSPPRIRDHKAVSKWLLERADDLAIKEAAPKPIVLGRHLIEFGVEPGPRFKAILDQCFQAQIDGVFDKLRDGKAFAKELLSNE